MEDDRNAAEPLARQQGRCVNVNTQKQGLAPNDDGRRDHLVGRQQDWLSAHLSSRLRWNPRCWRGSDS